MQIVNQPKRIQPSAYDEAIDAYVKKASCVQGVSSIHTMGSIRAPGLSDIDIIVVVEDDFDRRLSSKLSIKGIDARLFLHGPIILPKSLVSRLQYIIYATNICRIYGNEHLPAFDELDDLVAGTLHFSYLIDFLESRQVQYVSAIAQGQLDQRAWMARLWSLTHSEELLSLAGGSLDSNDQDVLDRIKDLRYQWLVDANINVVEFKEVFFRSVQTSRNILMWALKQLYSDFDSAYGLIPPVLASNKLIKFEGDLVDCEYRIKKSKLMGYRRPLITAMWNPLYYVHLCHYGLISNDKSVDLELNQHLSDRAQAVKEHWKWLARYCPKSGSMAGYLGLTPVRPIMLRDYAKMLLDRLIVRGYL